MSGSSESLASRGRVLERSSFAGERQGPPQEETCKTNTHRETPMCELAGRVMSPDGRQNSLIAASVPDKVS